MRNDGDDFWNKQMKSVIYSSCLWFTGKVICETLNLISYAASLNAFTLFLLLSLLTACSDGPDAIKVWDKELGLDALVFTFPPEQNKGFVFLDVPDQSGDFCITAHWDSDKYSLMINGGYFDQAFAPVGLCRIDGKVVNETVSEKLSGFVALDEDGCLHVLTRDDDLESYPSIIQTGPYVIDPGGKVGIKTQSKMKAARTLVGATTEGAVVVVVVTEPISLYDLAHGIKKQLLEIERLLNLDGGPSTALKTGAYEIVNVGPVRNYIALTK